jgi:hypothetical protein
MRPELRLRLERQVRASLHVWGLAPAARDRRDAGPGPLGAE